MAPRRSAERGGAAAFVQRVRKGVAIAACVVVGQTVGVPAAAADTIADARVLVQVNDGTGAPIDRATVITTVLWTAKTDFEQYGRPGSRIARTDVRGAANVDVRLSGPERAAVARNGGWLNLSVVVIDQNGHVVAHTATSRYLGDRADERAKAASMRNADVVRLTGRSSSRVVSAVDDLSAVAAATSCTYYWDDDGFSLRYAQVGELHVDYDVSFARFTYGRTADTTFDVGVKSAGSDWSISGSVHIANAKDTSVYANAGGQTNYHWALRTQFRFVHMKLFKDCLGGPYRAFTGSEEWDALEWTGGGMTLANTLTQPARKAVNTATYGPHTGWSRAASALTKWSAAVFLFGVTLGAQSGASSNVKIEYSFGGRSTHYLFGDTALPGTAKRVFQDTP